ncbi:MAG: hypothetical protein WDZ74_01585 [Candidatus Paceibacterota bacterium]
MTKIPRAVYLCFVFSFLLFPSYGAAQVTETTPIAQTVPVADAEVAYGDIILFDPETELFRRSEGVDDSRVYGVVVRDPTLLLETDVNLVPVAESGRLLVNVTLENGSIEEGDALVSSQTPGKGMRASEEHKHIIGYALESFDGTGGVREVREDGSEVVLGTIEVRMGTRSTVTLDLISEVEPNERTFDPNTGKVIARFGFAAIVALASIALTFIAFLSTIRQSVISVGRNPLAKSSIRSMVILNIVLALIVTTVGIFFAISLLIVPV